MAEEEKKRIGRPPREPIAGDILRQVENAYYRENNFFGRDKLYKLLRSRGIDVSRRQISDWLSKQEVSQLYNPTKKRKTIRATIVKFPFGQVAVDLIDMQNFAYRGFKYALTAVDLFSKKGAAVPLKNKSDRTVLRGLQRILRMPGFNTTRNIRSDNGSEFTNNLMRTYLASVHIGQQFSNPYTPQSNGAIEAFNKTLKGIIRKYIAYNDRLNWPVRLNEFVDNYNNTVHSSTGQTPDSLAEEKNQDVIRGTAERLSRLARRRLDEEEPKFHRNDIVRIKEDADDRNRFGFHYTRDTYKVHQVFVPQNSTVAPSYSLVTMNDEKFPGRYYNNDLLKVVDIENNIRAPILYEISKLVEPVINNRVRSFVVAWKGYRGQNTIEPLSQLREDAPKIVEKYIRDNGPIDWRNVRRV